MSENYAMSAGGARFFALEKFPNAMKHRIVGNYLKGALPTLANWSKKDVWYADLFAGAGRYDDGQPGSPLIIANFADERFRAEVRPLIHCFNVERDPKIFALLERNTADFAPEVIENRCGDWSDHLDDLIGLTQPGHLPLVLFLDPFGFKGIELMRLVEILSGIGSEARELLLTLNLSGMQRMVAAAKAARAKGKTDDYEELPDLVFGTRSWRNELVEELLPDEALPRLVNLYEEQLLKTGGSGFQRIVASIGVPTKMGGPDAYFIVFTTRSTVGFTKMNDAVNLAFERAWKEEESRYLIPEAVTGLQPFAKRSDLFHETLPDLIVGFLRTQPFGTKLELIHRDLALKHFGQFRMTHLTKAFKQLAAAGMIVMNPPRMERDTFVKWSDIGAAAATS